jgi:serine protease Do
MRNGKTNSLVAWLSAVVMLSVLAHASGQPWPEAHSGAYLGVQVKEVTSETASALKLQAPAGAVIAYVDQDGPACHAGLLENDVVIAFDGAKVEGPQQLQNMIHVAPPQKTVVLTIVRNGQRKDVKVTLGSWNVMSHARAFSSANNAFPAPPRAYPPDIEIPSFTLLSARHGLVVESLSPQLADFFGISRGRGVLVRSVEGGSPAAAAGLKAGDVILKVNNEDVHDMSDWQRGMRAPGAKLSVLIWRDKKEQSFIINVPGPGDNSRLMPSDILNFDTDAQVVREQIEQLKPELAMSRTEMMAQLEPGDKEMKQMRREFEKSMKAEQKEMKKMSKELAKSAKPAQKDLEQMRRDMQKSMPSQKDFDEMKRQVAQSMPSQKDMDEMKRQMQESMPSQKDFDSMKQQIQASMPSQKEIEDMRHQIESAMQNFTPQMQQEMEQLKKQMEQQKLDMQKMMQEFQQQEF